MQKLQRRKAALARTSTLSEDEKTALLPCFVAEVMSSDESDNLGSSLQNHFRGGVKRLINYSRVWIVKANDTEVSEVN